MAASQPNEKFDPPGPPNAGLPPPPERFVTLKADGGECRTAVSTLWRAPGCKLARMLQGARFDDVYVEADDNDDYIIDCDVAHLRLMIEFLRGGCRFHRTLSSAEWEGARYAARLFEINLHGAAVFTFRAEAAYMRPAGEALLFDENSTAVRVGTTGSHHVTCLLDPPLGARAGRVTLELVAWYDTGYHMGVGIVEHEAYAAHKASQDAWRTPHAHVYFCEGGLYRNSEAVGGVNPVDHFSVGDKVTVEVSRYEGPGAKQPRYARFLRNGSVTHRVEGVGADISFMADCAMGVWRIVESVIESP